MLINSITDFRLRLRWALRIQSQFRPPPEAPGPYPLEQWIAVQRCHRLETKARQRGWFAAARRIRGHLMRAIADFQEAMISWQRQLQQPTAAVLTLRQLLQELASLDAEFSQVDYDLAPGTLAVVTEPIVLEDIDLGPFRIELQLGDRQHMFGYQVIAIEPRAAAADDEVTHPHVRNGHLCEGEGTLPIRRALADGRLFDFFQIVQQILLTYNAGSAYIPLDDWNGVACVACGDSVSEDERTRCWISCRSGLRRMRRDLCGLRTRGGP